MTDSEWQAHALKMQERSEQIEYNGWEDTFSVQRKSLYSLDYDEEVTYDTYRPIKVDRIFRNSDLAWRLSLVLGPNFFPSYRWERLEDVGDTVEEGFHVYKKTLYVTYYPFGVKKTHLDKLLSVARRQAERVSLGEKTNFHGGEYAVGHESLCALPEPSDEEDYSDMPPLIAAKPTKEKVHHCFCSCGDESE